MDRVELLRFCELIQNAEIERCEFLPVGSNRIFVAGMAMDGQKARVVYKPCAGETPLRDFPGGTLYKREYAAFRVSLELGWDLVPPTVIRNGPYGIGSMQLMIETSGRIRDLSDVSRGVPVFRQVALFDCVVNNADRKAGHLLKDRHGRLWIVDHGLTFHSVPKLRTVLWDFAGEEVPGNLLDDLKEFREKLKQDNALRKELLRLLRETEIEAMERRISDVLAQPVFPRPSSPWSVPWPWY